MSSTSPIARNIARGNSLPGLRSDDTCTAFISMPEYDRKLFTISTRLARPAHAGSRLPPSSARPTGCPGRGRPTPSMTSSTPGISVPMIRPPLDRPATPLVPARRDADAGPEADHDDQRGPDAAARPGPG